MTIQVRYDIPIPKDNPHAKPKYPWATMRQGGMFVFPAGYTLKSAQALASRYSNSNNKRKFLVRENGKRIRCWRTK